MTEASEIVAALEIATARAIALDAPLRDRLRLIADEVRNISAVFAEAVDRFVGRLQEAEAGVNAPAVGELMPDFLLPDQHGRLVGLSGLLEKGPVVVAFLRGHWCPYCQTTAAALGDMAEAAAGRGARIVAITPENRRFTQKLAADSRGRAPILSDVDNGYALALNLAVWVDDDMARLIHAAGWNIPAYNNNDTWILPIPATFVVDRHAMIVARHVDADYRTRMEIADIQAALSGLARTAAGIA